MFLLIGGSSSIDVHLCCFDFNGFFGHRQMQDPAIKLGFDSALIDVTRDRENTLKFAETALTLTEIHCWLCRAGALTFDDQAAVTYLNQKIAFHAARQIQFEDKFLFGFPDVGCWHEGFSTILAAHKLVKHLVDLGTDFLEFVFDFGKKLLLLILLLCHSILDLKTLNQG
jgi:hypothetical protein